MPSIELRKVSNFILRSVNLKVEDGEIMVILGPNGSGKTTLLNVVAGLVPYKGSVRFSGTPVDGIPPEKRHVGYLFQDLFLFPHMTVMENISFGLKMKKIPKREIFKRVEEVSSALGIEHLLDRYPGSLSGGERQKVALARAIAPAPEVLLLDEPFSSLDTRTTKRLRVEFRDIIKNLSITSLFVTHDVLEAEELGDRICVVVDGSVVATGKFEELVSLPRLSSFFGTLNIFPCESPRPVWDGLFEIKVGSSKIVVPSDGRIPRKVAIYAHEVFISKKMPPGPSLNRVRGRVVEKMNTGSGAIYRVDVGGSYVFSELPSAAIYGDEIQEGDEVVLIFKLRNLRILE